MPQEEKDLPDCQSSLNELACLARRLARADEVTRAESEQRSRAEAALTGLQEQLGLETARADAAEQRVAALLSSTSWRVTAPLRYLAGVFGRQGT